MFDEVHIEVIYLAPSFPALQYLHSCCRRKRGLLYMGTDTYPTLGKGKSSTQKRRLGKGYMICLVPKMELLTNVTAYECPNVSYDCQRLPYDNFSKEFIITFHLVQQKRQNPLDIDKPLSKSCATRYF